MTNNAKGVAGIDWKCKIMPIRMACKPDSTCKVWSYEDANVAEAIDWAWKNGADVLSNSWGGGTASPAITHAIRRAKKNGCKEKGCVIIFAAGNNGGSVSYPASLREVIAVGATDRSDKRKSFSKSGDWASNFGSQLALAAPGVGIWTTDNMGKVGYNRGSISKGDSKGNYYNNFFGTSAAAPHVAGVAALVLSIRPNLLADEVKGILQKSAEQVGNYRYDKGRCDEIGAGRLNAASAIKLVISLRNSK